MNRYLIKVKTARTALKQITDIVPIQLTVLQEKFAVSVGYKNWKEFINVNEKTSDLSWISIDALSNIIEDIFDSKTLDVERSPFRKILVSLSKLFLVDNWFLKEIYKKIPDSDFHYIQKSLLGEGGIDNDLIAINTPILLSKEDNNLNIKNSIERCLDNFLNKKNDDYIYISSETILPDIKQTTMNGIRLGANVFVLNYVFDENSIWHFIRLLFGGSVVIFSGKDALRYKEAIEKEINIWAKNNEIANQNI